MTISLIRIGSGVISIIILKSRPCDWWGVTLVRGWDMSWRMRDRLSVDGQAMVIEKQARKKCEKSTIHQ